MKQRLYILFFLLSIAFQYSSGQNSDTLFIDLNSYERLPLEYNWLYTSNPAAITNVSQNYGKIVFTANSQSGKNKLYSDPDKIKAGIINAEDYKQVKSFSFFGKLGYNLSKRYGQKWNDVLFLSKENPFVFADSIGGDYDMETIEITGGMAAPFKNNKLKWGVITNYIVGNAADQTDPRPLIKSVRYSIRPGIIYNTGNWTYGADFSVGKYDEETSISVVDYNINHHFFLFMGLGNYYPNSGDSYTRLYTGRSWEGNLQAGVKRDKFHNIFQAGYGNNLEIAEDGGTYEKFKAGDYKENSFKVTDILRFQSGNHTHLFALKSVIMQNKGIWYDQKQIVNENNEKMWTVYNKSVKYKSNIFSTEMAYTLLKKTEAGQSYWVNVNVNYTSTKSDFFPEGYFMKYSNLTTSIAGSRFFILRNGYELSFKANAGYRYCPSKDAMLTGIKLADVVSIPAYNYYTSPLLFGNGTISAGKNIKFKTKQIFIYMEYKYSLNKNQGEYPYYKNTDRVNNAISLGFNY